MCGMNITTSNTLFSGPFNFNAGPAANPFGQGQTTPAKQTGSAFGQQDQTPKQQTGLFQFGQSMNNNSSGTKGFDFGASANQTPGGAGFNFSMSFVLS